MITQAHRTTPDLSMLQKGDSTERKQVFKSSFQISTCIVVSRMQLHMFREWAEPQGSP